MSKNWSNREVKQGDMREIIHHVLKAFYLTGITCYTD
jgi:hypothetical protein